MAAAFSQGIERGKRAEEYVAITKSDFGSRGACTHRRPACATCGVRPITRQSGRHSFGATYCDRPAPRITGQGCRPKHPARRPLPSAMVDHCRGGGGGHSRCHHPHTAQASAGVCGQRLRDHPKRCATNARRAWWAHCGHRIRWRTHAAGSGRNGGACPAISQSDALRALVFSVGCDRRRRVGGDCDHSGGAVDAGATPASASSRGAAATCLPAASSLTEK